MQQALQQAERVVVSGLAHPEVVAALTQRQHRDHAARLSARQVTQLLDAFERDWETFYVVPLDEALLMEASALVIRQAVHGLRAMDAIHVVSARVATVAFDDLLTPGMVAGLTDHPWTIEELLRFRVLLPQNAA